MQCQKQTGWLMKTACKTKAWLRLERLDRSDKVVEDLTYCPVHLHEWMFADSAYWMLLGGDEWSSYACSLEGCGFPATFRLEVPEYMRPDNKKWSSHYLCKPHLQPFAVALLKEIVDALESHPTR